VRLPRPLLKPVSPDALALAGLWTTLLDVGLALLAVLVFVDAWAPSQDLPWKPLELNAPVGLATQVKFARAAADPALCRRVLSQGAVRFTEVPARQVRFCSTANSLRLTGGVLPLSPAGPVLSCPEALSYAFWTRHAVQPAARKILGSRVVAIDHYGSYACRNVYGEAHGRPSEHARANALDVAGFRLADGRRVTVAADFRRADARGDFVRRVRSGACSWFHAVLSPDYNAAHRDHLHLDFGRYSVCS
jgi:hypothetical protein